MFFFEALLPSAVLLVLGLIHGNNEIVSASVAGLALGTLPFICVIPIKRISDYYEITGLIFGLVASLIVFVSA